MSTVPPDIRRYGKIVKQLERINSPSSPEKHLLDYARLRLAVWACEEENMKPSRENLRGILGDYAVDALKCYERMVREGTISVSGNATQRTGNTTGALS
ncbi:MAG: hypothetical protein JXR97_10750 [Planctomycetes bacterium]|nr:hypothetical protein [Planctomycetota bacterium]